MVAALGDPPVRQVPAPACRLSSSKRFQGLSRACPGNDCSKGLLKPAIAQCECAVQQGRPDHNEHGSRSGLLEYAGRRLWWAAHLSKKMDPTTMATPPTMTPAAAPFTPLVLVWIFWSCGRHTAAQPCRLSFDGPSSSLAGVSFGAASSQQPRASRQHRWPGQSAACGKLCTGAALRNQSCDLPGSSLQSCPVRRGRWQSVGSSTWHSCTGRPCARTPSRWGTRRRG